MAIHVGIDIAARSFDVACREAGQTRKTRQFAQTAEGHAQAARWLRSLNPAAVVLEATGVYYLDLAVALAEAGLPVSVINPRSFRHFAQLKLVGTKTDRLDAALLAEYAERMTPPRWQAPDPARLALRDIGRQINRLVAARTQARNRLHALQSRQLTAPLLIEDEQEGIAMLEGRLARLQAAAMDLVQQSPVLSAHLAHMTAAKGIGTASALALLGELCVLPEHLKAPQVSRHAGLDVRLCQSGTSVNRPARLSKAGNAWLRSALYMPAMSAIRHDPRARAFYESLVARGKKRIQALCAVMRKYLTGLWACLKTGTPFDSTLLFSDCHGKNA